MPRRPTAAVLAVALASGLALAACDKTPAAPPAPPPRPVTEAAYCHILDRVADRLEADLRAARARPDLSQDEARAVLTHMTPLGARPYTAAAVREAGFDGQQVGGWVQGHRAEVERCSAHFGERLNAMHPLRNELARVARGAAADDGGSGDAAVVPAGDAGTVARDATARDAR